MTLGAVFIALSGIGLVLGAFAFLSGTSAGRPRPGVKSIAAFVSAFGLTGFVLTQLTSAVTVLTVTTAIAAGLGGVWLTALAPSVSEPVDGNENVRPSMVGMVGRLSLPIREGGFGELYCTDDGVPRICAARSEDGSAIDKGTEVIVTSYDGGTATVRCVVDLLPGVRHAMNRMERSTRAGARG